MRCRIFQYVVISSLAFVLTGCSGGGSAIVKKNQTLQGPTPVVTPESFQKIDLVYLLDPEVRTESISDNKKKPSEEVLLADAFNKFYELQTNIVQRRNRIQERILAASNQRCGEYKQFLKRFDSETNLVLGGLTTLIAGAGAIFTRVNTVRALSGTAAIFSGFRAEVNEAYFQSKTVQVLTDALESKRRENYHSMLEKRSRNITNYTVEEAIKDAVTYHSNCSVVAALEHAAISIERAENPGLRAAQSTLIRARNLQRIAATPIDESLSPDLLVTQSLLSREINFTGNVMTIDNSEAANPQVFNAIMQREVKLLADKFRENIKKLKDSSYKNLSKDTELDNLQKYSDTAESNIISLLEFINLPLAKSQLDKIQNIHSDMLKETDSHNVNKLHLDLNKAAIEAQKIALDANKFPKNYKEGLSDINKLLIDSKQAVDSRLEKSEETIRTVISQVASARLEHAKSRITSLKGDVKNSPKLKKLANKVGTVAAGTDEVIAAGLIKKIEGITTELKDNKTQDQGIINLDQFEKSFEAHIKESF